MSDRKIISINPELFNLNNTRKKNGGGKKQIKIKEQNNKSTKSKLLRYIRERQNENYKKLFDEKEKKYKESLEPVEIALDETMNNEFENSLLYLNNKLKEDNQNQQNHNYTIKNKNICDSEFFNPFFNNNQANSNLSHVNNIENIEFIPKSNIILKQYPNNQIPLYGCLKNGKLPTYRNYIQQTRKNNGYNYNPVINIPNNNSVSPIPQPIHPNSFVFNSASPTESQPKQNIFNNENLKKISELKQIDQLINNSKSNIPKNLKYLKQKKTLRRTFNVGKSSKFPRIGVLVSNRTIRKNITTKTHLLKQESIHNIKKFLIKKGFIKVGSTAPNDVLRKMYESIVLVGGDIVNHNPDNLLYNYFHE